MIAGAKTVSVIDNKGCTTSGAITVGQPTAPSLSLSKTDVSCFGGSDGTVTATVSGGTAPYSVTLGATTQTISSSGGSTTFTGLTAGSKTVSVSDAKSCTTSGSITVNQPAALSESLTKVDVSCNGGNNGSVTITVSGGTAPYQVTLGTTKTINVDGGSTTFASQTAGSKTVSVTDAKGCTTSASITVNEPAAALSVTLSKTDVSCFGGSDGTVTATVIGGTAPYSVTLGATTQTISTSGGSTTFTGLTVGSKTVSVTDAKSCTTSGSILISQPAALSLTLSKTDVSCN
ncbi:MAG: hypothetical protein DME26_11545, partial [Verrucomicrobia bacterium]